MSYKRMTQGTTMTAEARIVEHLLYNFWPTIGPEEAMTLYQARVVIESELILEYFGEEWTRKITITVDRMLSDGILESKPDIEDDVERIRPSKLVAELYLRADL